MDNKAENRNAEKRANDYYRHCFGTETYHQYNRDTYLTDGVKELAETEECFWFLDVIESYQNEKNFKEIDYQKWFLERVQGNEFKVTASNLDNGEVLAVQEIPFSDFFFKELVFLKKDNIILLPSED